MILLHGKEKVDCNGFAFLQTLIKAVIILALVCGLCEALIGLMRYTNKINDKAKTYIEALNERQL